MAAITRILYGSYLNILFISISAFRLNVADENGKYERVKDKVTIEISISVSMLQR